MKLVLPYPPSGNRFYRNYGGRVVMSQEARDYKLTVALLARTKKMKMADGDVTLRLDVFRPRKSGDLDNRLKVVLDALQGVLYKDDAQIVELHARRFDDKRNPRIEVTLG